jgi:hypothetical protein
MSPSETEEELYERCPICKGTRVIPSGARMCIDPPSAVKTLKRVEGGFECFSCGGQGFVPTGILASVLRRILNNRAEARRASGQAQAEG